MKTENLVFVTMIAMVVYDSGAAFGAIPPGEYGPVFEEGGLQVTGDHFSVSPQAAVNLFGGNLVLAARDVSIPSAGDFAFEFKRVYSVVSRDKDGPLGLGWVGHYGLLIIEPGKKPQFINASGARELFYTHDQTSLATLKPTPAATVGISPSLNVLEFKNNTYYLYTPDGLRYQFAFRSQNRYVPISIRDKAGNVLTIAYHANDWWWAYPEHPVVESVADEVGRTLSFVYATGVSPPRLKYINLRVGSTDTEQSEYVMRTSGTDVFLERHKTPLDRSTDYDYRLTPGSTDYRAITSITLPTGGQTTFTYVQRDYIYSGGAGYSRVLAVATLQKGTEGTWAFSYPALGSSGNNYVVAISGPNYSSSRTFYGYTDRSCGYTEHWKVGRLLSMTETLSGYTRSSSYTWNSLKVSNDAVFGSCGWSSVYGTRLQQASITEDGFTTTTTVDTFHVLAPEDTSTNTGISVLRTMDDWVSVDAMVVGRLTYAEKIYGGVTVAKVAYSNFINGQPRYVDEYRNASTALRHVLDYYTLTGRKGRLQSRTTGTYTEIYNYQYGVLKSIDYPSGPDLGRTITADGKINLETSLGNTIDFGYDSDGRITSEAPVLDAPATITYSGNTATITKGSTWKRTYVDSWGRLSKVEERIDGTTVNVEYSYDAYDRPIQVVNPKNLSYTQTFDIQNRLRSKASSMDSLSIAIQVSAAGVTTTITKNGGVVIVEKRDFMGRYIQTSTNSRIVDFSYTAVADGIRQTISPVGGVSRAITHDWLGNRTRDEHPEMSDPIVYGIDSRGWVTSIQRPEGDATIEYYDNGRLKKISRIGYTPGNVEYGYDPTYGSLSSVVSGGATKELLNFDLQGRPRQVKVTVQKEMLPPPSVTLEFR